MRRLLIIGALVLTGCDLLLNGARQSDGGPGCTVTLSGAVSATYGCTAAGAWSNAKAQGAVNLSVANPSPYSTIAAGIAEPRDLSTTTWHESDTGEQSLITVSDGDAGTPTWIEVQRSSPPTSQGSFTLTLSSADVLFSTSGGKEYAVHGTLDAMLPALTGGPASGTVAFHAEF